MKILIFATTFLIVAAINLTGCSTAPKTSSDRAELHSRVLTTIETFKREDPGLIELFNSAHGYAVFPSIGKGGFIVGGAYGKGEVFEGGRKIGYCDVSMGSIGAQIGGQTYSEVIFFQNEPTLLSFKNGEFAFSAQATAVIAKAGAAANTDYEYGVLVFKMPKAGAMAEASVAGQQFSYLPEQ